jgi:hypothetical protein
MSRIGWTIAATGWIAAWLGIGVALSDREVDPTDTNVEFYYVPAGTDPSEWHNEDSHPICCANETETCRRCINF